MAGLIAQGMQAEEPVAPEEQPDATPESEASDEDIAKIVLAAETVLYEDATHDSVMQMLKSGASNPADSLARVTSHILTQLDEISEGSIPEDAILPASIEILTKVAELAEKTGTFQADEEVMGQAVGVLFSIMEEQGWVTEEDKAEIQQILAEQEAQPQGAPNDQLA